MDDKTKRIRRALIVRRARVLAHRIGSPQQFLSQRSGAIGPLTDDEQERIDALAVDIEVTP